MAPTYVCYPHLGDLVKSAFFVGADSVKVAKIVPVPDHLCESWTGDNRVGRTPCKNQAYAVVEGL